MLLFSYVLCHTEGRFRRNSNKMPMSKKKSEYSSFMINTVFKNFGLNHLININEYLNSIFAFLRMFWQSIQTIIQFEAWFCIEVAGIKDHDIRATSGRQQCRNNTAKKKTVSAKQKQIEDESSSCKHTHKVETSCVYMYSSMLSTATHEQWIVYVHSSRIISNFDMNIVALTITKIILLSLNANTQH